MKAREVMRRDLTSVEVDTTVFQVIYLMHQSGLSSLPVVDEDGRVVGIISEQDLIRAVLPGYVDMLQSVSFLPSLDQLGRKLRAVGPKPVAEFMEHDVLVVRADDTDLHLADLMLRKGLKQIPVVDEQGRMVGVVRRIDLLYGLLQ
ncbi:TPA: CBS domain-containing protein [Candidatus Acetothermia bacterium]|nr:CBS domain-containing protein [Candidatus Acetothermia bacterium]HAZ30848.1 CBS domain-containing protein [Candidatus Acetothermia bacterium]